MKKIITIATFYMLGVSLAFSVNDSRNGRFFPAKGDFRIFIVFAEVLNDPLDYGPFPGQWEIGQLPSGTYCSRITDRMEKYFQEASWGQFNLSVDYCPQLIQINTADQSDTYGVPAVLRQLDALCSTYPNGQMPTPKGFLFPDSFDIWRLSSGYSPKSNVADGKVDFIAIFFRSNTWLTSSSRNGGRMSYTGATQTIANKTGCSSFTVMSAPPSDMSFLLRHEFTHGLLGGNEFHSGIRGAGVSTYIHNFSGYGLLSLGTCSNDFCNAWDRRRLGWMRADSTKNEYIGAISITNPNDTLIEGRFDSNTDLTYNSLNNITRYFRLRDFTKYGDVVRIKLPHIPSGVDQQWIWLENHQPVSNTIEWKAWYYENGKPVPKGMYVNYQVGNESFTTDDYTSRTNYYTAEYSFGHYDISQVSYDSKDRDKCEVHISDSLANPFTGYNFMSAIAIDGNNDNRIANTEEFFVRKVTLNSVEIPASDCHYQGFLLCGSKYDAFTEGQQLNISTNPTPVPRLTHNRYEKSNSNISDTIAKDNRKIYLNGLSIKMEKQYSNGDICVSVRCNDFDVKNDVRWCGDIVLNEQVNVKGRNTTLLLDHGLSATRPQNPKTLNGKKVFDDATIFTCKPNSTLRLTPESRLIAKNGSTIIIESGAALRIENAKAVIESGSKLIVRAGGIIIIQGNGILLIRQNSCVEIDQGANIILQDKASHIAFENLYTGVQAPTSNYYPYYSAIRFMGNGSIIQHSAQTVYLQNTYESNDRTWSVKNASIGRAVTTNVAVGDYRIANQSIITAENEVIMEDGAQVEAINNAELIIHIKP